MDKSKILYWCSTSLVILAVGVGSIGDLVMLEAVKVATRNLHFPVYVLPLFGMLKIVGSAAGCIVGVDCFLCIWLSGEIIGAVGSGRWIWHFL
jgi:hypothetical protein